MEKFLREPLTLELLEEMIPLFVQHNQTVAQFPDIPFNPAYETYLQAEAENQLRAYIARDEKTNEVLGYCVFFIGPHQHRKNSQQARENVLYIRPEFRNFGGRFIEWCDSQLALEGIELIYRYVKPSPDLDHGSMLKRKGYELTELTWCKRLEREAS